MIITLEAQCPICKAHKIVSTDDQAGEKYLSKKKAEIKEWEKRGLDEKKNNLWSEEIT
ncbi:MAG: hypothetical protein PHS93_09015 [Candidatus Omnitrophica bacterium]|nr:hypothetical protein [Candidatus Omnitrophota bacterium]MDD5353285.1 hypothetical protein [Candidatus Omnitrophota bacterium]